MAEESEPQGHSKKQIFFKILFVFLVICQIAALDYFVVHVPKLDGNVSDSGKGSGIGRRHEDDFSGLKWLVPTAIIAILVWIDTVSLHWMHKLWRKVKKCWKRRRTVTATDAGEAEDPPSGNEATKLPTAWLAWIIYAVSVITPRIIVIFRDNSRLLAYSSTEENGIKVAVGVTTILFLILINAHEESAAFSRRRLYLERIEGGMAWDLLDTVELLETLLRLDDDKSLPGSLKNAMIAFSCINIITPFLALLELRERWPEGSLGKRFYFNFKMLYILANLILIDFSYLVIRIILWRSHGLDISAFFVKNIACIWLNGSDLYEFYKSDRPRRCSDCHYLFMKSSYQHHMSTKHGRNDSIDGIEMEDQGRETHI